MSLSDPLDFSFFEQQANARPPRTGLNLRFYSETRENKARSLEKGWVQYDIIDFVEINVAGSKDTFVEEMKGEPLKKYGAQYAMWKKTQEQPVDGTPITMCPFLNIAQIKEYQALNVNTIEQLAELSDTAVQKLGMGAMEARKKAQAYMKAGADNAATQRVTDENLKLRAQMDQQALQIADLTRRIEALMAGGAGMGSHEGLHHSAMIGVPQPPAAPAIDIAELVRAEIRKALGQQ